MDFIGGDVVRAVSGHIGHSILPNLRGTNALYALVWLSGGHPTCWLRVQHELCEDFALGLRSLSMVLVCRGRRMPSIVWWTVDGGRHFYPPPTWPLPLGFIRAQPVGGDCDRYIRHWNGAYRLCRRIGGLGLIGSGDFPQTLITPWHKIISSFFLRCVDRHRCLKQSQTSSRWCPGIHGTDRGGLFGIARSHRQWPTSARPRSRQ